MEPTKPLDPSELPNESQARSELGERLKGRARETFARGELISAMLFASDALMLFPNERQYLDLADEIALAAPDPLSTVPVATGAVHVATAAVRARILMMQKRLPDAIELLCRVIDAAPDLGYLPWLTRWCNPEQITRLGWDLFGKHVVRIAHKPVELTAKEFDLLLYFAQNPGRVYTRAQLLDAVWGYGHSGYEHTVNSHINRLRAKIEKDPEKPCFVLTVWGVGYKFEGASPGTDASDV